MGSTDVAHPIKAPSSCLHYCKQLEGALAGLLSIIKLAITPAIT
jgi:hypothetical protein